MTAATPERGEPALALSDVDVSLPTANGPLRVLRSVSFEVAPGRILALAGESGSGKSTAMMAALRLLPSGSQIDGSVRVAGQDVLSLSGNELRALRARHARVVLQDPWSCLHPMRSLGAQLVTSARSADPTLSRQAARDRAGDALNRVGIPDATARMRAYPHQLSGGQLQRVVIAAALVASPKLLLCDEPTTALDVTTQAQVLELLRELNAETGLTIVIATHDLDVIDGFADELVVMYAGSVVEHGPARDVLATPSHPYSWALLEAAPQHHAATAGAQDRLRPIVGQPPNPAEWAGSGCSFADRCAFVHDDCRTGEIRLQTVSSGRSSACLRVQLAGTATESRV